MPPDDPPPTGAGSSSEEATQPSNSGVQGMDTSNSTTLEEPTSVSGSSVNPDGGTGNESP